MDERINAEKRSLECLLEGMDALNPILRGSEVHQKMRQHITQDFETAEELLQMLTMSKDELWCPPDMKELKPEDYAKDARKLHRIDPNFNKGWFFRGQQNAEWDLVPGAWRIQTQKDETLMKELLAELEELRTLEDTNKLRIRINAQKTLVLTQSCQT